MTRLCAGLDAADVERASLYDEVSTNLVHQLNAALKARLNAAYTDGPGARLAGLLGHQLGWYESNEAAGVIARTHEHAGTDDQRPVLFELPLAEDLEPAVALRGDLLLVLAPSRRLLERGLLGQAADPEVGVDGDRGDEDVTVRGDLRRGLPDLARNVAAAIDDRIPTPLREGEVAVPEHFLGIGEEPGVGPAAMEKGEIVAPGERGPGEVAADESGSAEEEELHKCPSRNKCFICCLAVM